MMSFTLHFQLYPIKALLYCYIVSFFRLFNKYLKKIHVSKRQLSDHFKTANVLLPSQKLQEL